MREENDIAPDTQKYTHGLTPPIRDARRRRLLNDFSFYACCGTDRCGHDKEEEASSFPHCYQ